MLGIACHAYKRRRFFHVMPLLTRRQNIDPAARLLIGYRPAAWAFFSDLPNDTLERFCVPIRAKSPRSLQADAAMALWL